MRYCLFLHYGWFLQNLEKGCIGTNMHTTVLGHSNFHITQLHYLALLTTDNEATEERSEDLTQRVVISNEKKSEEYAIIAPNGAPILASSVPGIFF